jgi:predicted MFS family arabinose efflux permease
VTAGLVMPLLIIDTPERAKWLSDDEKRYVDLRLRLSGVRANTEEGDKLSWKLLFQTMTDWKVMMGIILAWANSVPNAAFKFTMPQIIKQLGFSTANAQLLTMPPYVCGGIAAWLTGKFSDRLAWRMPFIVGPMTVLLIAMAVLFNFSKSVTMSLPCTSVLFSLKSASTHFFLVSALGQVTILLHLGNDPSALLGYWQPETLAVSVPLSPI